MTSFVAWVGVDTHGPASLYLASDSRISWSNPSSSNLATWDCGRKVFASQRMPDLLGYVGDVLFPSLVLGQIASAIDCGVMFRKGIMPAERFSRVRDAIEGSFAGLPSEHQRDLSIVYATREGTGTRSEFFAWVIHWAKTAGWTHEELRIPLVSGAIKLLGSGMYVVEKWRDRWDFSSQGRTSRAVFSSFCDALSSTTDPLSGGTAQLVGLYRIEAGRPIGVVQNGRPHLFGLPMDPAAIDPSAAVEWRSPLFERCDSMGRRLEGAQRHHKPKGLGNTR